MKSYKALKAFWKLSNLIKLLKLLDFYRNIGKFLKVLWKLCKFSKLIKKLEKSLKMFQNNLIPKNSSNALF